MLAVDKSDVQVAAVGLEAGSLEALGFCLQDPGAVFYHSEQQRSCFCPVHFFVSYWDVGVVISLLYSSTVWPQLRA